MATGAANQGETGTAVDSPLEVAQTGEGDPSGNARQEVYKTPSEQWDEYWSSVSKGKRDDKEIVSFPPAVPKDPPLNDKPGTKPLDTKPSLSLLSIDEMVKKFPDLKTFVFGSPTAHPELTLDIPNKDSEFRAQYVKSVQEMARNHGLSDKQVQDVIIKLYAYESGGNGGFDMVAGMHGNPVVGYAEQFYNWVTGNTPEIPLSDHKYVPEKSSAIGYKQLIMATTMGNLYDYGPNMSQLLRARAKESVDPAESTRLTTKADFIEQLREKMFTAAVDSYKKDHPGPLPAGIKPWTLFDAMSKSANTVTLSDGRTMTGREFTSSIQALNLDKDIGPLIQTAQLTSLIQDWHPDDTETDSDKRASSNLKDSLDTFVNYMQEQIKSFDSEPLDVKLKALNAMMDQAFTRGKPTPIDYVMKDAVTRKLTESFKSGEMPDFNEGERKFISNNLLLNKIFLDPSLKGKALADSPEAQEISKLFLKLNSIYFGGLDAEKLTPAVFEMANLLGAPQAKRMLDPAHSDWRTVNFTDQRGYKANQMLKDRRAVELLFAIHRIQNGSKSDDSNAGIRAFRELFAASK